MQKKQIIRLRELLMKITTKCRESDKTLKEIFAREPSSKDKEIKKSAFRYILQERCG